MTRSSIYHHWLFPPGSDPIPAPKDISASQRTWARHYVTANGFSFDETKRLYGFLKVCTLIWMLISVWSLCYSCLLRSKFGSLRDLLHHFTKGEDGSPKCVTIICCTVSNMYLSVCDKIITNQKEFCQWYTFYCTWYVYTYCWIQLRSQHDWMGINWMGVEISNMLKSCLW